MTTTLERATGRERETRRERETGTGNGNGKREREREWETGTGMGASLAAQTLRATPPTNCCPLIVALLWAKED